MADKKISELNSITTPLDGTEEIPIVQSGETKKGTINDLIEANSLEGYNETGTRADGDLIVKIGDYDDSFTGFKVVLDIDDESLSVLGNLKVNDFITSDTYTEPLSENDYIQKKYIDDNIVSTLVFGGINQWSMDVNGNFFKPNENQGYNNTICNVDSGTTTPLDVLTSGTTRNSSFCRVFEDGYSLKKVQLSGNVATLSDFRIIVVSAKRTHNASSGSEFTDTTILYDNTFTGINANSSYNYDIDTDVSVDASEIFVFYAHVGGASTILFSARTDLIFQK